MSFIDFSSIYTFQMRKTYSCGGGSINLFSAPWTEKIRLISRWSDLLHHFSLFYFSDIYALTMPHLRSPQSRSWEHCSHQSEKYVFSKLHYIQTQMKYDHGSDQGGVTREYCSTTADELGKPCNKWCWYCHITRNLASSETKSENISCIKHLTIWIYLECASDFCTLQYLL